MCKNCKLFTIFTIFVLVVSPAHFCVLAAEPLSEIKVEISGEGKNGLIGIPAELITRKLRKRDATFAISVESVLRKLKKKEKMVLVDVRNREEFEKFRIPGSINIPLFAIKTKTFLKHKPLVLINDGYHYSPLERECKRLKDSGFTAIWILHGGLSAWRKKGATVNGDIFAQKELNKMPAQIFFEEKNDESWVVIDISRSESSESRYLLPQAISIPFANDAGDFVSSIKRVMERHEKNSFLSFLIFNENGEQYEKIEKLIEEAGLRNVFYLKEGLRGYNGFLKRQALMWQSKDHSRKTLKKCPGCP